MLKKSSLILSSAAATMLLLSGCGGGGSSEVSSGATEEVTIGQLNTISKGSTSVSALNLPSNIDVIKAADEDKTSKYVLDFNIDSSKKSSKLYSDDNTDYNNTESRFWVRDDSTRSLDTINMIMDFIKQTRYEEFVNKGPYIALVKDNQESKGGSANDSKSGGSNKSDAEELREFVMDVTRANDDSPMVVRGFIYWEENSDNGGTPFTQDITFRLDVLKGVSTEYPAGVFTMYVKGEAKINGQKKTIMRNILQVKKGEEIDGSTNSEGTVRVLFKDESNRDGGTRFEEAHLLTNADFSSGAAFTKGTVWDDQQQKEVVNNFKVAYNNRYVKVKNTTKDSASVLLDKQQFDYKIYRYGLFSKDSGAKIDRNAGKSIILTKDGKEYYGYAGYWGIWAPHEIGDLTSGVTIKDNDDNAYTVFEAKGQLRKHTKEEISLADLDGIEMNMWTNNGEKIIVWNKTEEKFKVIATQTWGNRGPERTDLDPVQDLTITNEWQNAWCNSMQSNFQIGKLYNKRDQSGKEVKTTPTNSSTLTFHKEETVMPGDTNIPSTLTAYDGWKYTGKVTSSNLSTAIVDMWNTGIDWQTVSINDFKHSYSFDSTSMTLYAGTSTTDAQKQLVFESDVTQTMLDNNNIWGMHISPLLTNTELSRIEGSSELNATIDLGNWWEIRDRAQTFYSWNSGINEWDRLTVLKDASNNFVKFEQPLEFTYKHTTANDRKESATNDGKTFILRYDGQSLDMPWKFDKERNQWVPEIALKDGTTLTHNSTDYVVKALEGEKMLKKVTSVASGFSEPDLNLITVGETNINTSVIDSIDFGTRPTNSCLKVKVSKGVVSDTSVCDVE